MGLLLSALVATSETAAATRSRTAKVRAIAELLAGAPRGDAALAARFLAGQTDQERLDVGWSAVGTVSPPPAATPSLTLAEVNAAFQALADASGTGSRSRRLGVLSDLLAAATESEQRFLRSLMLGDVRQGALEGVVVQAVALAAGVPEAAVRRALMLRADLGAVAARALAEGEEGLAGFRLEVFRPVQPMLASTAPSVAAALADFGRAAVEWKLDGIRVQVHRRGDAIRVYSRNLRDLTARSPGTVAAVRALEVDEVILDGELLWAPFFFDVLRLDDQDLLDAPGSERAAALAARVPSELRVPRSETDDPDVGEAFYAEAVAAGHEGVVVKALDAPYQAGRRGSGWRKVKPAHNLDLVVLAVEWGSGRRQGWLSNLHLGARDPEGGGFVMLGKTFKGMTDATLIWQTRRFLELEVRREAHVVHIRPEQVVEIAVDGVQRSTRYPGGVALRFARVVRYRSDKSPSQADTLATVRSLLSGPRSTT
jgi:DNA ligase-1